MTQQPEQNPDDWQNQYPFNDPEKMREVDEWEEKITSLPIKELEKLKPPLHDASDWGDGQHVPPPNSNAGGIPFLYLSGQQIAPPPLPDPCLVPPAVKGDYAPPRIPRPPRPQKTPYVTGWGIPQHRPNPTYAADGVSPKRERLFSMDRGETLEEMEASWNRFQWKLISIFVIVDIIVLLTMGAEAASVAIVVLLAGPIAVGLMSRQKHWIWRYCLLPIWVSLLIICFMLISKG